MSRRFVLLEHTLPDGHPRAGVHWDLMFELESALLTFALPEPVCQLRGRSVTVERLPDHRLLYLDYEGPVSGDRGDVVRRSAGHYEGGWEEEGRVWRARLQGEEGEEGAGEVRVELSLDGEHWRAAVGD